MATLTIKNVQKRYGTVAVLKGIDLELQDGEFLVLLGPSGCGKSTLLNMIAGLDTITDGAIEIDGRVINDIHPKDRDIAMVFQSYALYPNMSVARNIAFGLEMRGMNKPDREVAVKKVAALLQMEHLLDRKPAQLSGGQRQRVAMGRALVRDPKVFLFDEPLSNLDAKLRVDMRTEIKKLHQRLGTTIVYVTHDQIEAMTLATRIAIMKEGVVQQFAPPQEVYEQPANIYVASFIGSPAMNFIPAQIVSEADRIGVRIEGAQGSSVLPIPEPSAAVLQKVGHDVILGVRPETIARYQHGTNLPPNFARFSAQVSVTEPTGADTLTYLALGGRDAIARVPPKEAPNAGEVAEFTVDMARACLFDPKTEQRVG